MKPETYFWNGKRIPAPSLDVLMSLLPRAVMDPKLMRPRDLKLCRWLGYGIIKGLTSTKLNVSIFGLPETHSAGLHGEMIRGIGGTDPSPLCYDRKHKKGFGSFVRWVFFKSPGNEDRFLGIDFSLGLRKTSGVATTWKHVYEIIKTLAVHGLLSDTEIVLLNWRMCEPRCLTGLRRRSELVTAQDWMHKGKKYFGPDGIFCPTCGQKTFTDKQHTYCYLCGCNRKAYKV